MLLEFLICCFPYIIKPLKKTTIYFCDKMNVPYKAIVWKEDDTYIAKEPVTSVASQGESLEEALRNLEEALELYLEEMPEMEEELLLLLAQQEKMKEIWLSEEENVWEEY